MRNKFNIKSLIQFAGSTLFIIASCSVGCQTLDSSDKPTSITISVEEGLTPKEQILLGQNSLNQATDGPDECDKKFPFSTATNKNDPYADTGPETCKKLKIRGQRMQCEIDSLVLEKPESNTTGAKIELASWARCNGKIADLLIEGYYLPASEIERRLQICSSNYYADPGKMPKAGWYQRFLKWYTSNDLTPPPTDAALEVALKQSTPLDSRQDTAGLMKCEWMFGNSRTPQIDPLPSSSNVVPTTPAKRPVKK
ncbi:hypothetical protein C2759_02285 [Polynucleobacter sp. MG-Unter2-18]|uniref:hypothetical protein n=1 Tax=Polynucleobacter sp. MG-Unter2-18 TaxID=2081052 RepID=UPI001BFEB7A6|nr:hypothetical protein [Polynucleobacter sp. MG-Unter2-18]QWD94983.1 hypothetical protein C2759_02285 [Polynucleobacter sp. MG-Unter2-18]